MSSTNNPALELPMSLRSLWEKLQQEREQQNRVLYCRSLDTYTNELLALLSKQDHPDAPIDILSLLLRYLTQELKASELDTITAAEIFDQQQRVSDALRIALDPMLRSVVKRVIGKWKAAGLLPSRQQNEETASDVEVLATIAYGYIFEALLKKHLDPATLVTNYFARIAEHGTYREYGALLGMKRHRRTQQSNIATPQPEIISGSPDAKMWPPTSTILLVSDVNDLPDPDDEEAQILAALTIDSYWKTIWEYVARLSSDLQLIFHCRWKLDPPLAHQAIADKLGKGWNANRVVGAYNRTRKRILNHLQIEHKDNFSN